MHSTEYSTINRLICAFCAFCDDGTVPHPTAHSRHSRCTTYLNLVFFVTAEAAVDIVFSSKVVQLFAHIQIWATIQNSVSRQMIYEFEFYGIRVVRTSATEPVCAF